MRHLAALLASAGGLPVNLDDETIGALAFSPATSTAGPIFKTTGLVDAWEDSPPAITAGFTQWWRGGSTAGVGNNWQVRATPQSGTSPNAGDALNTWLTMNVDRSFLLVTSAVESLNGIVLFEIRALGGTLAVTSGLYDITSTEV